MSRIEVAARPVEPARLADAEVLFCSVPPSNHGDLRQLKWLQIASAGYSQLFGLDLPRRLLVLGPVLDAEGLPVHRHRVEPRRAAPGEMGAAGGQEGQGGGQRSHATPSGHARPPTATTLKIGRAHV